MTNRISNLVCFYRAAACLALVLCAAGLEAQTFPAQPINVSQTPASNSSYPTMVVDALGDINVAWIDNTGINFSRSTNSGNSFLPPVPIGAATVGAVFQPQMLVDSTGNIVEIAWAKPNPAGNFDVFVSRSTDGGLTFGGPTFPAAIPVSTTPVALVDSPRLAFVGAGVDVVWGNDGTWISTSLDGIHFGAPIQLSVAAQDSGGPRIAVDNAGNIFVGWTDRLAEDQNKTGNYCTNPQAITTNGVVTGFSNLFGGNYYVNETLSGTTPSNTNTHNLSNSDWKGPDPAYPNGYFGCSYDNLQLFFDKNDNLHLLWGDEAPLEDLLTSAATPSPNGTFPTFSFPKGIDGDEGVGSPNAATDSSGSIYFVYAAGPLAPSSAEGIYFNRSDDFGKSFALPESSVISAPGAISPAYPQIAVDSNGNVDIVWQQADQTITSGGNTFHLFFARSTDRGNTFPTIIPIPMPASALCIALSGTPPTTPDTTTCGTVQMGLDSNSNPDVAWVNNSGSGSTAGPNIDFAVGNMAALPPTDFTISVNPTTRTGFSGQTVAYTVTASAIGNFTGSITLGCNDFRTVTGTDGATIRRSDFVCSASGPLNAGSSATVSLTIPTNLPVSSSPYQFAINGTSAINGTTHRVMVAFNSVGPAGSVQPSAASLTVGASANFTVNITQSAFTQTVNLLCSGQPAWIKCVFNPSSITPSAGSALTSTLTVTVMSAPTTSLFSYPPSRRDLPPQRIAVLWSATLAAMCLMTMLTLSLRRRDNIRTAVAMRGVASMMLTLVLAIGLVSCGGATGSSAANANTAGTSGLTPGSVSSGGSSSSSGSGGTGGSSGGPSSSPVTTTFSVQAQQSGNVITNLGTVSITAQ